MGSPWNERRTEEPEDDEHGTDRPDAPQSRLGLKAAELDLLRSAPDYDAEEMASVRPTGGWPAPEAVSLRPEPSAAVWAPPNRVEPPAAGGWKPPSRVEPPLPSGRTAGGGAPGGEARTLFPEERTVALLAEDLLGRSLDEPAPAVMAQAGPSEARRADWGSPLLEGGTDLWESAMPLLAEG